MQTALNVIDDLKHDMTASPVDGVTIITSAQLAALEAALSAAEPVAMFRKAGENTWLQWLKSPDDYADRTDLYAAPLAPPAPSVAVKALKTIDLIVGNVEHEGGGANSARMYAGMLNDIRAVVLSALSAQVQDENEIVDCLTSGKPFVFDPATNFCHADDGGAPEHGIKYVPAAQVQDVAGLPQDVIDLVIAAREFWDIHNDMERESKALDRALEKFASRVPFEDDNLIAPATPAKQEG